MRTITLTISSFILAATFFFGAQRSNPVPPPAPPAPASAPQKDVPPPAPPSDQISISAAE